MHFTLNRLNLNPIILPFAVDSIHYYDSILVIEKRKRTPPKNIISGEISFEKSRNPSFRPKLKPTPKSKFLIMLNRIIRRFRIRNFLIK